MGSESTNSTQKRSSTANGGARGRAAKGRQHNRTINNIKITILCGIVTILVLRGTIGLSNLVSLEADAESQHLIEETKRIVAAIRSDDDEPLDTAADASNPDQTLALGPKITRWDENKKLWRRRNPQFPYYIKGRPRIILATASPPGPCENAAGDHYMLKFVKNKIDYCRIHGIEIVYNMANMDREMAGAGNWAKLPLMRRLMVAHPEAEWLWWMDNDAVFTDMVFEIPFHRYRSSNLIIHGDPTKLEERSWIALNTGSFLLRNSQWSLDLLDAWAKMGRKGHAREEAGKILTETLKGRPEFEADEQSALIYLLITERERWMKVVYIERSYFLQGFWEGIVDRYEEMMEKFRPGFGDERWPFVTHFVGCRPCGGGGGGGGDYPAARCFKNMERAFNFADNQVLKVYGFRHRGLVSPNVKRIRNESVRPLMDVDEFGIRNSLRGNRRSKP